MTQEQRIALDALTQALQILVNAHLTIIAGAPDEPVTQEVTPKEPTIDDI